MDLDRDLYLYRDLDLYVKKIDLIKNMKQYDEIGSFFEKINIPADERHRWVDANQKLLNQIYAIQILVIGKTGYGKSSTINRLLDIDEMLTDSIDVCTKNLQAIAYQINMVKKQYLLWSDVPGVGESLTADKEYINYYKKMIDKSDIVLFVLRADTRDYAIDEMIYTTLFNETNKHKVIFAINFADKIEPISRNTYITDEQIVNLDKKLLEISKLFKIQNEEILYYSADLGYNLTTLMSLILKKLKRNTESFTEDEAYKRADHYSWSYSDSHIKILPTPSGDNIFFPELTKNFISATKKSIMNYAINNSLNSISAAIYKEFGDRNE